MFLDKARLSHDGKITRAAMLLVGKDLASHKLTGDFSNEEKICKITTWMTTLRKLGMIENIGTDHDSHWILSGSNVKSNVESGATSTMTLENKDRKSR